MEGEATETERKGADQQKVDGRTILDDFTNYPLTDIGSSKLYADMFKNELRFVREMGLYFYYNGKVWVKDVGGIFAKVWRKNLQLKQWTRRTVYQMIKPDVKYYNKLYLYNCQNGTFNLKTGKLQKHNARDMLTQISNVIYDAAARCERWEKYVDEIMRGDEPSKNLLRMIAGHCLASLCCIAKVHETAREHLTVP